jgi:hypothetical protein
MEDTHYFGSRNEEFIVTTVLLCVGACEVYFGVAFWMIGTGLVREQESLIWEELCSPAMASNM